MNRKGKFWVPRFSVRTLLIITAILALLLATVGRTYIGLKQQRFAVE